MVIICDFNRVYSADKCTLHALFPISGVKNGTPTSFSVYVWFAKKDGLKFELDRKVEKEHSPWHSLDDDDVMVGHCSSSSS